ncbi:MAG: hypothetical protein LBT50_07600 [Prevotellaceae bacterium]|jgi:hypothetical protein|nr:hypothetical protein [Prevotellaceae bacterium]
MSKQSKKTVSPTKGATNRQTKKEKSLHQATNPSPVRRPVLRWLIRFFSPRSILVAIILAFGVYEGITEVKCYKWVWENYLKENLEFTHKYAKKTTKERLNMKLGFDHSFLSFINEHTPENAVILFTLQEHIIEKSGDAKLTEKIGMKMWVTHFIYPRRAVYKSEAESNPVYKDVTHVAICAGHGYEDLDYNISQKQPFTVLPKKPNNNENK